MKKTGLSLIVMLALFQAAQGAEAKWMTDLPKAQALAKEQKKLLLMDFTGSNWCPPCKALHQNVLTSKEFVDYAKDNLVLVVVDFPRPNNLPAAQQKANNDLAAKYQIEGFPTVIVLDSNGKELSKQVGYNAGTTTAKGFVAGLHKLPKPTS